MKRSPPDGDTTLIMLQLNLWPVALTTGVPAETTGERA